ncbi:MAG: hypothetical protein QM621_12145 [Aeromicrobium sp.]|uniref:DUF6542 domain-containing protein n=1 Tax=Aeromicrobium sp. TaxID=1871063 RepID=UPI0039E61D92
MAGLAAPATLAQRDLTLRGAALLATALTAAAALLDLADGRLGFMTTAGLLMSAVTVPLAVIPEHLWATIFVPPALLVGAMVFVSFLNSDALLSDAMPHSSHHAGRILAGTLDRGVTLAIAETLTIATIGLRHLWRR